MTDDRYRMIQAHSKSPMDSSSSVVPWGDTMSIPTHPPLELLYTLPSLLWGYLDVCSNTAHVCKMGERPSSDQQWEFIFGHGIVFRSHHNGSEVVISEAVGSEVVLGGCRIGVVQLGGCRLGGCQLGIFWLEADGLAVVDLG